MTIRVLAATCIALAVLGAAGEVQAEPIASGPRQWIDTAGNGSLKIAGPITGPVNFADGENGWQPISDDWEQVGQRQIWRVRGAMTAWCDSTGHVVYLYKGHYLDLWLGQLIRFQLSDSSYITLDSPDIDSATVDGRIVTLWGVYYGINVEIEANPRILNEWGYRYIFTQAFRDSAKALGAAFWNGRWLGTSVTLGTDSLGLTWHDINGAFDPDSGGVILDGWLAAQQNDSTPIFRLPPAEIMYGDSLTGIPVKKRIVKVGGELRLVELFDPRLTTDIPDGDLWHSARFGETGTGGFTLGIEDKSLLGKFTLSEDGTVLSITALVSVLSGGEGLTAMLYTADGNDADSIIDCVELAAPSTDQGLDWVEVPLSSPTALGAGDYFVGVWGGDNGEAGGHEIRIGLSGGTTDYSSDPYGGGCAEPYSQSNDYAWVVCVFATYRTEGTATVYGAGYGTGFWRDGWIDESFPTCDATVSADLTISGGAERALIAIQNLDAIVPASKTIDSLHIFLYADDINTASDSIGMFRVFKPWVQGTGSHTTTGDGTTWNCWDTANAKQWGTAGCDNADDGGSDNSGDGSGADRTETYMQKMALSSTGYKTWKVDPDLAQDWYDGDAAENGVIVLDLDEDGSPGEINFNSAEEIFQDQTQMPYFTIWWSDVGGPEPSGQVILIGGN